MRLLLITVVLAGLALMMRDLSPVLIAGNAAPRPSTLTSAERESLLKSREAVWRAWFANDRASLESALPPETIAINNGELAWQNRSEVIESAEQFVSSGGQLVRLSFPRTEIQRYDDVAILYSKFEFETDVHGRRNVQSGRATEVFLLRDGRWLNPGWHLDSGK
ncbi:MAG TPA: nuclear transport factor 2 family protein [Terriglobales bacterium]|nr:nuclear transport factor 2 family protein [Terriglobales bacterium]